MSLVRLTNILFPAAIQLSVRQEGFEPPTYTVSEWHSTGLSYWRASIFGSGPDGI